MKRIYLAGPMSGHPDFNYPAFHDYARRWRAMGWTVENPAEAHDGRQDLAYSDYVRYDLEALRACDAIALMPGWDGPNARGSVWEQAVAVHYLGLPAFPADAPISPEVAAYRVLRPTVLAEAQSLVHGDRGGDYGHPIDDYTRTGRMWGAILGIGDIDPRVACLMMAVMKVSREVNKHKRDNLVDLAGYAECAQMVADRQGLKG